MQKPIRIEAADTDERTQIGDALAKFARKSGRLETGRKEGKFFLSHEGGCDVGGEPIKKGETFYLDPETGELLCARHGEQRRRERTP